MMVRDLFDILPPGFSASPNVHLGPMFEIDVSAFENDSGPSSGSLDSGGGVATEFDEYEVRIYDDRHDRRLVAAIELVSPSNKDRPESRRAFLSKVEALLQKEICVTIVDIASVPRFNLYAELLDVLERKDPNLGEPPPVHYAVTLRAKKKSLRKSRIEGWHYPMTVGEPLPTLPIWLDTDLRIMLPLESSYQETCRLLHIA
jgi:hypothetical protein